MLLQCLEGEELTATERNVIEYVNKNIESLVDLTTAEIADKAFVSKATLFRALHKCGVNKITDIRYRIAKDKYVVNDTLNKIFEEYAQTIKNLDVNMIEKAAEYIRNATSVMILSSNVLKFMAEEMEFYLKFQKVDAKVEDSQFVFRHADVFNRVDVILVLTIEDERKELANCIKLLKNDKVTVITCCCTENTELKEYSDIMCVGYSHPLSNRQTGDLGSSLGLRAITRAIIDYLA